MLSRFQRHGTLFIGLAAQILQFGAALLLLPFIVTHLSQQDVGLWYIFLTIQGLAALSDFGFQPTIARGFAAAYAGAAEIRREGLTEDALDHANLPLVREIMRASRRLYLGLAVSVLVLLIVGGLPYLSHVVADPAGLGRARIAWTLFSIGVALGMYLLWISPWLMGAGRIRQNYIYIIISRGGFALFGIIALLAGGGLVTLATVNIVSGVVAFIGGLWLARPLSRQLEDVPVQPRSNAVLGALWPNASKMGVVALGGFLATRANVLIMSSFVGLGASASYAITLQILTGLMALAQLPTQISMPAMVALRVKRDMTTFRSLFLSRQLLLLIIFVTGASGLILIAPWILQMIGSRVELLSTELTLLLATILLLEANHANCAFMISTGNRVPFVWPALLSGSAVAALASGFAWLGFGALGVIGAQGLVQLLYNNWKWPLMLWQETRNAPV